MKNLKIIVIALSVTFGFNTLNAQTKKIVAEKSTIEWIGKKVTGQHSGTINLQDGQLTFKDSKVTGGSFIVDMTSISTTDLKGEWKQKLDGHLKSEDFFGTEKFKTSLLEFKKIIDKGNGVYSVTADLTIKEIVNQITFDLTLKGNNAMAKLIINRAKYDIRYGSGSFFDNLGDKTIYDDFELNVNLQF